MQSFLSDITTADGKLIGQHALSENTEYVRRPSYKFPRESPTKEDRIICKIFLRSLMLENFELPIPLGGRVCSTHRIWEYTINDRENPLWQQGEGTYLKFSQLQGRCCSKWFKEREADYSLTETHISVKKTSCDSFKIRCVGKKTIKAGNFMGRT